MSFIASVTLGVVGILGAGVFVRIAGKFEEGGRRRVLSVALAVVAAVYVVFALTASGAAWIAVEAAVALVFFAIAFAAARSFVLLAPAWALHVAWDVVHVGIRADSAAPIWYPPLCIGFDLAVAVYLLRISVPEIGGGDP
jgi:hypothetical protein